MGEAPRRGLSSRLWVARPWNSNPLLTGRHRFEATVCLFVALAALFAIPFVATIGTEVYATRSAAIEQANRDSRSVTAVLTTAPEASAGTVAVYSADASWTVDGRKHTGSVVTDSDAVVGDKVDVWTNAAGDQVPPPGQPSQAVGDGIAVAVMAWLGVVAVGSCVALAAHYATRREQLRRWEREWYDFDTHPSTWS
ncbi:MAG TPA: hypothetical protein VIW24_27250 [Aldersonia sp.]